jgi:hypothetical protein
MYEWLPYNRGDLDKVPAGDAERRAWLSKQRNFETTANTYRQKLVDIYGPEKGNKIKYCEAFQDSGYGTRLTKENMKKYFPFL